VLMDARIRIGADGTDVGSSWDGSFVSIEGGTQA